MILCVHSLLPAWSESRPAHHGSPSVRAARAWASGRAAASTCPHTASLVTKKQKKQMVMMEGLERGMIGLCQSSCLRAQVLVLVLVLVLVVTRRSAVA